MIGKRQIIKAITEIDGVKIPILKFGDIKKNRTDKIKKLPSAYPILEDMENDFKKEYINNLKTNFFDKLNGVLK